MYDMSVYGLHALTGVLGPAKRVTAMSGIAEAFRPEELIGRSVIFLANLNDYAEELDPHVNPLGVKGVGEMTANSPIPAIVNAIYHATGVRIDELPVTPWNSAGYEDCYDDLNKAAAKYGLLSAEQAAPSWAPVRIAAWTL